jgi:hypothetical protein
MGFEGKNPTQVYELHSQLGIPMCMGRIRLHKIIESEGGSLLQMHLNY